MKNVTQPTVESKSYVTMLPYFVRGAKRYRVNAFTSIPYTKQKIEEMENTPYAVSSIIEALDKEAKENIKKSYGVAKLNCELGHFVDQQLKFEDRPIKKDDLLPGINTITIWQETSLKNGLKTNYSSTHVIKLKDFIQTLRTFGIDVYIETPNEPLDDLTTALEEDIGASPIIEISLLYIKDLDGEPRQAIPKRKKFTQKI